MATSNVGSKHLLIGLPDAGKTTFLAALWHVVQSLRNKGPLRFESLEGSAKYLNHICEAWLECRKVPRTRVETETVVSMRLRDITTEKIATLYFPDLAGESFENQWTNRQWTRTYDALVGEAAGALLFINPDKVVTPERIDQALGIIAEIEGILGQQVSAQASAGPSTPWNPEHAPTQVKLVELLQFLRSHRGLRRPFRLAVIVSAWDRIAAAGREPREWVDWQLPLLGQFLETNAADFDSAFYGVSAQGGTYADGEDERLAERDPIERILVVGTGAELPNDLTLPLKWLIG